MKAWNLMNRVDNVKVTPFRPGNVHASKHESPVFIGEIKKVSSPGRATCMIVKSSKSWLVDIRSLFYIVLLSRFYTINHFILSWLSEHCPCNEILAMFDA